jgi:hypothetical protein
VFFTLRRIWTFSHFTPVETRHKLVIFLIIPKFLYGVMVSKALVAIRGRLKEALKIPAHLGARISVCSLDTYYNLRICCAMYRLIGSCRPGSLFDGLQFDWSTRLFNLVIPRHRTLARASSFFVHGAILWNGLQPAVRRDSSLRRFNCQTKNSKWRFII